MSDSHEWCRDVRRDEAVRAAEDAAAVPEIMHRDLPDVVAALTERVARLEAALVADSATTQPPPRGWLTVEEREAVEEAMVDYGSNVGDSDCERIERVLRALLARETPPRVKVPHLDELEADERPVWESACHEWIAAIRAAGGEVD